MSDEYRVSISVHHGNAGIRRALSRDGAQGPTLSLALNCEHPIVPRCRPTAPPDGTASRA